MDGFFVLKEAHFSFDPAFLSCFCHNISGEAVSYQERGSIIVTLPVRKDQILIIVGITVAA